MVLLLGVGLDIFKINRVKARVRERRFRVR